MEIDEAVYLFDKNKTLIESISPDEITVNDQEIELNGLITHEVEGVYQNIVEDSHFFGVVDIDDDNNFLMYKNDIKKASDGFFNLSGTYVLFDDLNGRGGVIKDRRPQNESVTRILPAILEGTGWQVGQVHTTNTGTSNYYYASKLEAFWDFLEKWNVEFKPRMTFSQGKITGKYIDIYDRLSGDYGKWYEYGDKLLTVAKEESSTNIFTAFIGRGKGEEVGDGYGRRIGFEDAEWKKSAGDPVDKPLGQDYVEIPEATNLYGYEDGTPRYTVVEFSDIEDEEELLIATYNHAVQESRPKVHFKSNVIEDGMAEPGETVAIIRDDLDIRYKTRIFKLKRNFKNKKVKAIEFGEHLVRTQAQRNKAVERVIKDNEKVQMDWLVSLRNQIIDSYYNDDGYNYDLQAGNEYDLPGGYYSFDRPIDQNPSKAIYMGAGRLLIANSKTPDGRWNWRTAATGDGIVADAITTGTLRTVLLHALNNPQNNYWDLDSGHFKLGNATDYVSWNPYTSELVMRFGNSRTEINGKDGITLYDTIAYRKNIVSKTGFELFNGQDRANVSGYIGYLKAKDDTPPPGPNEVTINREGAQKHSIGIVARPSHYVTLGYAGENERTFDRAFEIEGETGRIDAYKNINMNGYSVAGDSDIRLKAKYKDTALNALSEIEKMQFIDFEWDLTNPYNRGKPEGKQFGMIAQYAPELQIKEGDSYLSIDKNKQSDLNTKAIQELSVENKKIKQDLSNLKQLLIDKGVIEC